MKSGGPWNVRGLRPEMRAAAREAARASGMSVGEWLNNVIQPADDDDDDAWWSADFDRDPDDRLRPRSRYDDHETTRFRDAPPRHRPDLEPREEWRQSFREDDRGRSRCGDAPRRRRDRRPSEEWRQSFRDNGPKSGRYGDPPRRRPDSEPENQFHLDFRDGDRERQNGDAPARRRDNRDADDRPVRREGRPYREPQGQCAPHRSERDRNDLPCAERERFERAAANVAAENFRDASIDEAVAEITARQRALDGQGATPPVRSEQPQPAAPRSQPERMITAWTDSEHAQKVGEAAVDISGLEQQLRQMTAWLEALRPFAELEKAINGLRNDLAGIDRLLTEALPRRALESLEIEVRALGERIDHSRQSGVDSTALAGIEQALAEVREALHKLTPAEGLVGFDEAVKGLAKKIDVIAAKEDPAELQQLETAIGALRGIVSHVASNDTLTKIAEDVRQLSAKVDGLAASGAGSPTLSALENRNDVLAAALNASAEAGHSVPRELEKLLSGLIEKLEWVQLTHSDHTALAHLEDRIATLVKRLDASDARLGLLEGVQRGLADLLVYIEQLRGSNGAAVGVKSPVAAPVAADAIEHEVAEIKQSERRTQDSLEDMQGSVEQFVVRLAMIENDMRTNRVRTAPAEPTLSVAAVPELATKPAAYRSETAPMSVASTASDVTPMLSRVEAAQTRSAAARTPIDPSLPPNHPLEPGSTSGRSRPPSTAAYRIAASEAAIGSKPPVIPGRGNGKPDFIAAARRAAQAASISSDDRKVSREGRTQSARPKKLTDRLRTLAVAVGVVVIIVGGYHIISRLLEDGSGGPSPPQAPQMQTTPQAPTEPHRTQTETQQVQPEPRPPQKEPPHVEAKPPPAPFTIPTASSTTRPATVPMSLPEVGSAQHLAGAGFGSRAAIAARQQCSAPRDAS
jgi:localization factor PodJL